MPDEAVLTAALDAVLAGTRLDALTPAVERLSAAYRANEVPAAPLLGSRRDVLAYAAFRMPATFAAVRAALGQAAGALPAFAPSTIVDLGAGTGAASWAVADIYRPTAFALLEQSAIAVSVGRELAVRSPAIALRQADWRAWMLGHTAPEVPSADLAVAAYVLAELDDERQRLLVEAAAASVQAVLIVEPGTPAGHARVLAARARLLDAGFRVAAPCPHEHVCPLVAQRDWCHFAARIVRSERHRRVKSASLNYEDEKFGFVFAVRAPDPVWASARVTRRPDKRKGLVSLELCRADGTASRELVTKRDPAGYRAARDVRWGDEWPPRH